MAEGDKDLVLIGFIGFIEFVGFVVLMKKEQGVLVNESKKI